LYSIEIIGEGGGGNLQLDSLLYKDFIGATRVNPIESNKVVDISLKTIDQMNVLGNFENQLMGD
jgi:hypothetical protein